ncbi:hypothetical protein ACLMJK_001037 [Lecanora helva]
MESRYGLVELFTPPEDAQVTAYIIFVHGLFGHPLKTWMPDKSTSKSSKLSASKENDHDTISGVDTREDQNTCWPQTLLPTVISDAKILSFGYDADIDTFHSSAGQNTINQHAHNLLSDLADMRSTPSEREIPLIFVAYSLGGIIVKDALNESASTVGTRLKDIAPATFAVCFLGTPHRGSKSASMGKIAYNITMLFARRPNRKLLQGLEKQSEVLDRIGYSFSQTKLKYQIVTYSFFEEKVTRKYRVFSTMIVKADSAKIGDATEESSSIPANHHDMIRFGSARDIGFVRVSAQLRRWVEQNRFSDGTPSQDRDDCLNSLNDSVTRTRILEVHAAQDRTFSWLLDPQIVSFSGWLQNKESQKKPIYWINGKPGSGKSTLMKFAMRTENLRPLLQCGTESAWTVAAFFFHDRGSEVQKTLAGMLQGILHSILKQLPALSQFVNSIFNELVQAQKTRKPRWNLEALQSAVLSIFEQRKLRVSILLFLDALDEHDQHDCNNDILASLLKKFVVAAHQHGNRLKLCLASRSWTVFAHQFGTCPGFSIHDHTEQDILTYIKVKLEVDDRGEGSSQDRDGLLKISELIATKALGVFIWVRIVVDLVLRGIRDGTPQLVLENQIEKMPQELEERYCHTLERIESEYSSESYIMLQIALCSLVPLPVPIFMACVDVCGHICGRPRSNLPMQENTVTKKRRRQAMKEARVPLATHKSRLMSRSGGLLEVVSAPALEDKESSFIVQFIH